MFDNIKYQFARFINPDAIIQELNSNETRINLRVARRSVLLVDAELRQLEEEKKILMYGVSPKCAGAKLVSFIAEKFKEQALVEEILARLGNCAMAQFDVSSHNSTNDN